MKTLKATIFVLLASLHLFVLSGGVMIFTSLFKWAPWYEPCGLQVLGIWTHVAPALCVIGVLLFLFGFFCRISILSRLLSFLAAGLLSLPMGIVEWLHQFHVRVPDRPFLVGGVVVSIALFVGVLVIAIIDLIRIVRKREEAPTTRRTTTTCPANGAS